jgi:hypothetical protein
MAVGGDRGNSTRRRNLHDAITLLRAVGRGMHRAIRAASTIGVTLPVVVFVSVLVANLGAPTTASARLPSAQATAMRSAVGYGAGRDMAADPAGGYWTTTAAGALTTHTGATDFGSLAGTHLNAPIVGMAATPDGQGYWLVASDGGIFSFGDAAFFGSTGAIHLNQPIVAMTPSPDGGGYWLVASDGGLFTFGDTPFYGSLGGTGATVEGIVVTPESGGYMLIETSGAAVPFEPPRATGSPTSTQPPADTTTTTTTTTVPPPSTTSSNLLTNQQSAFNGTTGGWQGIQSNLSAADGSNPNTSALEVAPTATSWVSAWSALPPAGTPATATPGHKYTGSATVEASSPGESLGDDIGFYDSSGTVLATLFGQAVTPTAGNWVALPEVVAIAPAATAYVTFGVSSWLPVPGQDFLIQSPNLSTLTTPLAAPAVVGPLHTSGNEIVQANGQPVTLRGVVLPGLEQTGTMADTGVSQQAISEAKAWGANFVRVSLGEQFWLSSNCDYVPGYESEVDKVVGWITSLGMVALLDLHTNTIGGCQTGSQHNMADEAQSPTFLSDLAARYGNPSSPEYSPLVAFDLYNEPHDISASVWLNGGATTDASTGIAYEAAGMQQLYDAVRNAGSNSLTFISGDNWASAPPSTLVSGNNIVYAAHYYTCPSAAPPACSTPTPPMQPRS